MTSSSQGGVLAAQQPPVSHLRPTLAVLAVILIVNVGLWGVNALMDTPWKLDTTPLRLATGEGAGVQLTPRGGWHVDQARSDSNPVAPLGKVALAKGATTMTLQLQPSTAALPALWDDLQRQLTQRPDIDRLAQPRPVTTGQGARGLQAPLPASAGGGLAAVYANGQAAVEVTTQGQDFGQQAGEVTAMLDSLQFVAGEEG